MVELNPILLQASAMESTKPAETTKANPHNLVNIATAKEVGQIAQKEIGSMPYRVATAGYSAPPEGYEEPTKKFLKAFDSELGTRSTAFVTSPTADKGSIDAITSEVSGLQKGKVFYTTANDYVEYINPKNFPDTINTAQYEKIPKHVLPTGAEYSKATAEASNVFVATGGRNATVSDFVNAMNKGNKAIILDNSEVKTPAWGEAKGRVENASKYLSDQLGAFFEGKKLPHPELKKEGFTLEFMNKNKSKLSELVKHIHVNGSDSQGILKAAKDAAKFIRI